MKALLFFPADAHEGPVWVADQHRLYYVTAPHPEGRRRVDLEYLDFSPYLRDGRTLEDLPDKVEEEVRPQTFVTDANMANAMRKANDGVHFWVAEQGFEDQAGGIARYHVRSGERTVVVNRFADQEFNSPNKVIESRDGHLIFSDPDYAFRQGFRPPPVLEPNLYLLPAGTEKASAFRCRLEMPHGLALSPDESTLFVTDTSNDGAHGDGVKLYRRKSVWRFGFDPSGPSISGPGECCFSVDEGVPDGMVTTIDRLLVGGGDGVYVADLDGRLIGKIELPHTAVNLALAEGGRHLFVTADEGVYLIREWRDRVTPN